MKAYTDLEQSKKLAEILPKESADMGWNVFVDKTTRILPINDWDLVKDGSGNVKFYHAWSLAALLEIIKKLVGYSLQSLDTHTVFMNCELCDKPYNIETENYDNPIDACYEMVLKLNELNLL